MNRKNAKMLWGALIVFLILLSYILPYTIMSGIQAWYGSFLLWGIIGILIIVANIMVTRDWRE
ncbi:hypothetical protein F3157_19660 [Virgibacillus dakarensis]|uniref:Uncharacterized protein n=1 Tax=Lentibacillus populi TaxID=1827502 RepID=A0A9W5X6U6_9BACI|nr:MULTISPECIES: hypothetical protein [Bacillaceae]MBT2218285.1 hypothetical protein [Virgibacillus dakarensis]MTW87836.1 hypothetical protein [Virgibacillus dakarensis]GGB50390.1 hypothetical protein GCM10011409_29960 [Lentibacillus populi]